MTQSAPVKRVKVWYANGQFMFDPDDDHIVAVLDPQADQGAVNYAVVFTLEGETTATFPDNGGWILWEGSGPPPGLEAGWEIPPSEVPGPKKQILGINNNVSLGQAGRIYRFRVVVSDGGVKHRSHDPDIVLDPPSP